MYALRYGISKNYIPKLLSQNKETIEKLVSRYKDSKTPVTNFDSDTFSASDINLKELGKKLSKSLDFDVELQERKPIRIQLPNASNLIMKGFSEIKRRNLLSDQNDQNDHFDNLEKDLMKTASKNDKKSHVDIDLSEVLEDYKT